MCICKTKNKKQKTKQTKNKTKKNKNKQANKNKQNKNKANKTKQKQKQKQADAFCFIKIVLSAKFLQTNLYGMVGCEVTCGVKPLQEIIFHRKIFEEKILHSNQLITESNELHSKENVSQFLLFFII